MSVRRLLVLITLSAAACARGAQPSATPAPTEPPGPSPAEEAVTFRTLDGVTLAGRLFGAGPVGVVLGHMYPADARSWYPMARTLARRGYAAVALNFRGYPPSGGQKDPARAGIDMRAAYDLLRGRGATRVALVGASMGGTAAIIVASEVQTAAVVAVSAPTSFMGLDARPFAPKVTAPLLLLAARDDPSRAAASLRELAELVPAAENRLFDGSAHGTDLLSQRPEAAEELVSFLVRHAPPT